MNDDDVIGIVPPVPPARDPDCIYCGNKYNDATVDERRQLWLLGYDRVGTRAECLRKGFGAGMYGERRKWQPDMPPYVSRCGENLARIRRGGGSPPGSPPPSPPSPPPPPSRGGGDGSPPGSPPPDGSPPPFRGGGGGGGGGSPGGDTRPSSSGGETSFPPETIMPPEPRMPGSPPNSDITALINQVRAEFTQSLLNAQRQHQYMINTMNNEIRKSVDMWKAELLSDVTKTVTKLSETTESTMKQFKDKLEDLKTKSAQQLLEREELVTKIRNLTESGEALKNEIQTLHKTLESIVNDVKNQNNMSEKLEAKIKKIVATVEERLRLVPKTVEDVMRSSNESLIKLKAELKTLRDETEAQAKIIREIIKNFPTEADKYVEEKLKQWNEKLNARINDINVKISGIEASSRGVSTNQLNEVEKSIEGLKNDTKNQLETIKNELLSQTARITTLEKAFNNLIGLRNELILLGDKLVELDNALSSLPESARSFLETFVKEFEDRATRWADVINNRILDLESAARSGGRLPGVAIEEVVDRSSDVMPNVADLNEELDYLQEAVEGAEISNEELKRRVEVLEKKADIIDDTIGVNTILEDLTPGPPSSAKRKRGLSDSTTYDDEAIEGPIGLSQAEVNNIFREEKRLKRETQDTLDIDDEFNYGLFGEGCLEVCEKGTLEQIKNCAVNLRIGTNGKTREQLCNDIIDQIAKNQQPMQAEDQGQPSKRVRNFATDENRSDGSSKRMRIDSSELPTVSNLDLCGTSDWECTHLTPDQEVLDCAEKLRIPFRNETEGRDKTKEELCADIKRKVLCTDVTPDRNCNNKEYEYVANCAHAKGISLLKDGTLRTKEDLCDELNESVAGRTRSKTAR